jgi:hypothetical protein
MGTLIDRKDTGIKYLIRKAPKLSNTWFVWLYIDNQQIGGAKAFRTWREAIDYVLG